MQPSRQLSDSRLASLSAGGLFEAFNAFQADFTAITRRAAGRFEARNWRGMQADAGERLDLYKKIVDGIVKATRERLDDRLHDRLIWASMKAVYSGSIAGREDWEIAETFYNSITRRIFATVGVDRQIEFVDTDFEAPPTQAHEPIYRSYARRASTVELIEAILQDYAFQTPYANLHQEAELAAGVIQTHLRAIGALQVVERAEVIRPVFYRGKGAYLVGRMYSGAHLTPLVLALLNTPQGITLDAILLDENDVSILFSFAHSYFHVDASRPHDLISFLRTIMPRKRVAELYISSGYNKHGKTELYRDLLDHLAYTADQFEIARGEPGMVMTVFTMPSYDMVFKVIRDRFGLSKNTSRREVMAKYRLVFRHDRAGRLVDAQEFEHLKFERRAFTQALLAELQRAAPSSVRLEDEHVVISHLYTERRLTPLDVYVREAGEAAAQAAVIDYGNAIKDLAYTNIFPGDVLLKNFGVTRHGRIVFYDYDELCLLNECNFRHMPAARNPEDELRADPWFYVDENDIFPQEFNTFLGLQGDLREVFLERHADLFDADFWRGIQKRLREGEVMDIFPYDSQRRLHNLKPLNPGREGQDHA